MSNFDNLELRQIEKDFDEMFSQWPNQFVQLFKGGKISGELDFNPSLELKSSQKAVYVPIKFFNFDGDEIKNCLILIKRNDFWYLHKLPIS